MRAAQSILPHVPPRNPARRFPCGSGPEPGRRAVRAPIPLLARVSRRRTLLATIPAEPCRRRAGHLAQAWTEQFTYRDEARRERDVRRLEPVARTLLSYVAEEESRLRVTPR